MVCFNELGLNIIENKQTKGGCMEGCMNNVQVVQQIYKCFEKRDIQGILEFCAEEIDWDNSMVASAECPWNGNFSGRSKVPHFFKTVDEFLDINHFEPKVFLENGPYVAVNLRIASTVRKTNKKFENDSIHFWTFNKNGKVIGYRHFNDTAAELAAWKK